MGAKCHSCPHVWYIWAVALAEERQLCKHMCIMVNIFTLVSLLTFSTSLLNVLLFSCCFHSFFLLSLFLFLNSLVNVTGNYGFFMTWIISVSSHSKYTACLPTERSSDLIRISLAFELGILIPCWPERGSLSAWGASRSWMCVFSWGKI